MLHSSLKALYNERLKERRMTPNVLHGGVQILPMCARIFTETVVVTQAALTIGLPYQKT